MAQPDSQRRLKDALLSNSKALPNAANTVSSNIIDLGLPTPFSVTEKLQVLIETGLATGANNKNINFWLQHSATNNASNMANINGSGLMAITANTANFAASNVRFALPPNTLRYLRVQCLGEANGGNFADANFTASLVA